MQDYAQGTNKGSLPVAVWIGAAVVVLGVIVTVVVLGGRTDPQRIVDDPTERSGRTGALVDQVTFSVESDQGRLVSSIAQGNVHLHGQGIGSPTDFDRIRTSPNIDYGMSYGSSNELTINPVGPRFADDRLNPFHSARVREALNWLIDRQHIVDEIYNGLAAPRLLPLTTAFPDYARMARTARILELKYRHNPARARQVIHEEMEAMGARLVNGRWMDGDDRVVVRILIRSDDERQQIGDYLAQLMEGVGFTVERLYRNADEATRIWISGDPNRGEWSLYTGGWISNFLSRDQAEGFDFYYTSRGRPEPLWQAYQPSEELDELCSRLYRRDYETWEERQELMARALELALEFSVRVWLVDRISAWPRHASVDVAVDLAAGVSGSRLWPYTLRFTDQVGGEVKFTTPNLMTEPWNPVAGTNWLFDLMVLRALEDPALIADPFTGLFWPQRIDGASVTVRDGIPVIKTHDWLTLDTAASIEVPGETWIDWDPSEQRVITVAEKHPDGITSRTRVVVRYEDGYLNRKWHDGTQVSLADVVLGWIVLFDRGHEDSALYDPAYMPLFQAFQQHYRGMRIVSKDPLVVEYYSDQIYPDAEQMVFMRTLTATPWHVLAPGIMAERAGDLAFSSNKADQNEIEWMSYIAGDGLRVLRRHLARAKEGGRVPYDLLKEYMRDGEIAERYEALMAWDKARGHLWVGDGPFYLHSVHTRERNLVLRRFEDFPDPAEKWLRFTQPAIPIVELEGPRFVEGGQPTTFAIHVTHDGFPYDVAAIDAVRFMLFDARMELRAEGEARARDDGTWAIDLSAEQIEALGVGANSLEVVVTSHLVAMPVFESYAFVTE